MPTCAAALVQRSPPVQARRLGSLSDVRRLELDDLLKLIGLLVGVIPGFFCKLPLLGFAVDEWDVRWTFGGVAAVMSVLILIVGAFWMRAHDEAAGPVVPDGSVATARRSLRAGVFRSQPGSGD